MGRGRAAFRKSEIGRILRAARRAGVHVRVEIKDDSIIATTVDAPPTSPDDTAEQAYRNWKKDHASKP